MSKFQVTQRTDTRIPARFEDVQFDHRVIIRDFRNGTYLDLSREEASSLVMHIENATDRIMDKVATLEKARAAKDAAGETLEKAERLASVACRAEKVHSDCEAGLPRPLEVTEEIPF